MVCEYCGMEIDDNARVCKYCNAKLDASPVVTAERRFCTKCGSEINPAAKFCKSCGTLINMGAGLAAAQAGTRGINNKKRRSPWIISVAVLMAAVLFGSAVMYGVGRAIYSKQEVTAATRKGLTRIEDLDIKDPDNYSVTITIPEPNPMEEKLLTVTNVSLEACVRAQMLGAYLQGVAEDESVSDEEFEKLAYDCTTAWEIASASAEMASDMATDLARLEEAPAYRESRMVSVTVTENEDGAVIEAEKPIFYDALSGMFVTTAYAAPKNNADDGRTYAERVLDTYNNASNHSEGIKALIDNGYGSNMLEAWNRVIKAEEQYKAELEQAENNKEADWYSKRVDYAQKTVKAGKYAGIAVAVMSTLGVGGAAVGGAKSWATLSALQKGTLVVNGANFAVSGTKDGVSVLIGDDNCICATADALDKYVVTPASFAVGGANLFAGSWSSAAGLYGRLSYIWNTTQGYVRDGKVAGFEVKEKGFDVFEYTLKELEKAGKENPGKASKTEDYINYISDGFRYVTNGLLPEYVYDSLKYDAESTEDFKIEEGGGVITLDDLSPDALWKLILQTVNITDETLDDMEGLYDEFYDEYDEWAEKADIDEDNWDEPENVEDDDLGPPDEDKGGYMMSGVDDDVSADDASENEEEITGLDLICGIYQGTYEYEDGESYEGYLRIANIEGKPFVAGARTDDPDGYTFITHTFENESENEREWRLDESKFRREYDEDTKTITVSFPYGSTTTIVVTETSNGYQAVCHNEDRSVHERSVFTGIKIE